jgi:hypothetical protein
MSSSLFLDYFTAGTSQTKTGETVGVEIEQHLRDIRTRQPITAAVRRAIMCHPGRPLGLGITTEIGRQTIELALPPVAPAQLGPLIEYSLNWLDHAAMAHGAVVLGHPEFYWPSPLLDVSSDPRDQLWRDIDGPDALEWLCRIASVQYNVSVNPRDAIRIINLLLSQGIHQIDYEVNDRFWKSYIRDSRADYRADRYGGPVQFEDLADYVHQLEQHHVVMHEGQKVWLLPGQLPHFDVELHLRSIWWHIRLRRFADKLVMEIRPRSRRSDEAILTAWQTDIAPAFA